MIRVAVADDHSVVRKGLRQIISESEDLLFAGEAGSADELLTLLRSKPFDALVLDYSLGIRSGLDILKHVKSEFPRLPVLILSMHAEDLFAIRVLRAGASGYIQKEVASEQLLVAIHQIAAGKTYLSPAMAQRIAADLARGSAPALPHERLSDREFEVFRLLGSGRSVTEIAHALNLSVKTVSTHRTRILEKTGLSDNSEIVSYVNSNHLS
jgi:two-component system, NarL family, invasion response regulator UvrY